MSTLLSVNGYHYHRDGSEAIFLDHNRVFQAAGWGIVPFSMHHPQNIQTEWSRYFVSEIEFGQEYSVFEKIVRVPKVIYSLESRKKLAGLLERVHPDIAHCHTIYHHISPSILGLLKQRGVPTVMTLHDLKIACPAYHMFNRGSICEKCKDGKRHNVFLNRCIKDSAALSAVVWAESALHHWLQSYSKNIERFIAPCRFYIDKLVDWGWEREKFVHIPNFVDPRVFQPEFNPGDAFLYFGRLAPEKGLITLVRAAALAEVPLRLAGDGPQFDALRAEVDRVGADVTFLGRLSGGVLHSEIRRCKATVLPSEWFENAPRSILEGYALGKPAIGANIGGIPELIRPDTGWTHDSGSAELLAATLRDVFDTPNHVIAEMGRAARHLVESEYSADQYQRRVSRLYTSLGATAPCELQPASTYG